MNRRCPRPLFTLLVLAISLLTACTPAKQAAAPAAPANPAPAPAAPSKPVKGQVTGRATDSSGKPLANVTVLIDGITQAGVNAYPEPKTKGDGTYAIKVPDGSYRVTRGTIPVQYNGRNYIMPVAVADGDTNTSYPASEGVVRDLVWKISGLKAGNTDKTNASALYGATLILQQWNDAKTDPLWGQNWTMEITLTPAGPLIDGSAGKPIVYKVQQGVTQMRIFDIPVGDYTATARLTSGQGQQLRVATSEGNFVGAQYGPSARVEFPPAAEGVKPLYLVLRPD